MKGFIIAWVAVQLADGASGGDSYGNARLVQHLFRDYISDVTPECNPGPVEVMISMTMRGLLDVDEPRQIVKANIWLQLIWADCRLHWKPEDFDGVDNLVISAKRVWLPDVAAYDSVNKVLANLAGHHVRVNCTGQVTFFAPTVIDFMCPMDITYFPFDTQVCRMKFASWAYNGDEMAISNGSDSGNLLMFKADGEWDVSAIPVRTLRTYYACCAQPYTDVTFYVVMRRQHLYYVYNLLMPCIIITAVALLMFCLPPEGGEKISLGLTVLLSLVVFLMMVTEKIPATSGTIAVMQKYFAAAILVVSLSCTITVVVINLHHKGRSGRPVPSWMKRLFFDYLAFCLCVGTESLTRSKKRQGAVTVEMMAYTKDQHMADRYPDESHSSSGRSVVSDPTLHCVLRQQLQTLRTLLASYEKQRDWVQTQRDWKTIAMIIDRLFFVGITILTVILTCVILMQRQLTDDEYFQGAFME